MSSVSAALSAACRQYPLREKIVIAPSLAVGHQIGDAVARNGTSWINLRFETVRTVADAIASLDIATRGLTVLSRAQSLALIERACDEVLDASSYFAPLRDRPGLHRAIQRTLDDLRHAGIAADRLTSTSMEDQRKARDLALILGSYERQLISNHYIDRLGVLERAIELLENGASWPGDAVWMVMEEVELTAREGTLVELVSGGGGERRPSPGLRPPSPLGDEAAVGRGASDKGLPRSFNREPSPLVRGEKVPKADEGLVPPAPFSFHRALGEENEIRGAFRAVLDAGLTFDDAEIVYTARDPYLALAFELSSEYGVPCTFAEGIPALFTRPGQACLAFLRWMGNGWHAIELQRIASGRIARVLRNAAIGWGRDRHLQRIDALIAEKRASLELEEDEARRTAIERAIADAHAARELVEPLLEMTEPVAESMDVSRAAAACAAFVRTSGVSNEADIMAREGLARMFGELAALTSGTAPERGEVASRLSEAVRNLHVSASNPRPGHLHVAPIRFAGWSGRPRVFVAGLDETRHPGTGLQDPILLDVEREAIGIPIVGDRPQRTTLELTRLLDRVADQHLTLSWPWLRLRDRREMFPAPAVLDAYRQSTGNPTAKYQDLSEAAIEERFVDPMPLSDSEWWLYRRFVAEDRAISDAVLAAYPALAAGAEAEAQRDGSEITRYDGRISAPAEELDPRLNGRTYSASQLERLASCPYRYFLERVLRIAPLEELAFDPDVWLEAREFGSMLHEVLQKAMDELCAAGRKPALTFLPRMEEIAAASLAEWRQRVPPPSESAFRRREHELVRSCEVFLRTEETACADVTPMHFEFGFDGFQLPLGEGKSITLRGFIDRIDRDDSHGGWHVWDYKSGRSSDFEGNWRLRCGTKMQHALYARAVEAKLGGRVTKSGYLFPTPRGRGARIERECTDHELREALNGLANVVATGWFPHADQCQWCDFKTICGGNNLAAGRARTKMEANPSDPAVQAWRKLQEMS